MNELWQRIAIVVVWVGFTLWHVQPVPGKGLPIGRRWFRHYLNRRQAMVWGTLLVAVGLLVALVGFGTEQTDVVFFAFFVTWLGGVYLYQATRMKSPRGA